MAITLKILGLFLLVGGLAATVLGWPYRMIDWGNIQVILGGISSACGLTLVAAGVLLSEVRHLRQALYARTAPAPEEMAAAAMPARMEPVLDGPSSEPSMPSALPVPTVAMAAAAAGVAGAVVLANHGSSEPEAIAGEPTVSLPVPQPDTALQPGHTSEDVVDDRFSAGTVTNIAEDGLVWIKPDDRPAGMSVDALTDRINEAAGDLTALRREILDAGHDDSSVAATEPSPESVLAAEPEAMPAPDDPGEPDNDLLRPSFSDVADGSDHPDPIADTAADHSAAEADELLPEPAAHSDAGSPDPQPAANSEGVVSVHTVGDATFTMYNDGTIRADTPDGAFGFSTVADLKAYLAGDRTVARALG